MPAPRRLWREQRVLSVTGHRDAGHDGP